MKIQFNMKNSDKNKVDDNKMITEAVLVLHAESYGLESKWKW